MSALAALCLCALLGSDKVELRFAPVEGSHVRRTITIDQTLAAKGVDPITTHKVLRTIDQFRKVGEGRPLLLQRRFEKIDWGSSRVPPLQGTSVVYTWVPEEGAYGKYYDAAESKESALRDLAEDLDLRALLPTGAVALRDTWSVPAAKLGGVFTPLGDLEVSGYLAESTGECKLTLASVTEQQGHSLATVELALKFEGKVWSFEGRGTFVWDLSARHAMSFDLQGNQALHFEAPQPSFTGTFACSWAIEDPKPK